MMPFVIDIETAGRTDAANFLPEITAPANYKDLAKIEAYLAEKRATQLESAALSAETARILCVGILRNDGESQFIHDQDESALLRATWRQAETREAHEVFVTFNGSRFDWPMLARRSYSVGVPVPSWFPVDGRWPPRTHCDLFALWQAGDRHESISLDRLARLCGLPGKSGSGANFAMLWQLDREAALDYLRRDLELTRDLWERMSRRPPIATPCHNDLNL
jgi:predicted PolB exonuclease-like 3'-5' exonuclease